MATPTGKEKERSPRRKVRPVALGADAKPGVWEQIPAATRHGVALTVLFVIALGFCWPVTVGGDKLVGSDTVKWFGMAEAMRTYEAATNDAPLWAPNLFSGMPGYLIYYPLAVPQLDTVFNALRNVGLWPLAHLLLLFGGMYALLVYLTKNEWAGVTAAVAYGLTTYIPLILTAGHNTKFIALAYAPWLLLAFVFALNPHHRTGWVRPVLAGLLFAGAMALNMRAQHIQITYYVLYILAFWWLFEGIAAVREKRVRAFATATGVLVAGGLVALLMVAQPYLVQAEYKDFTVRGVGETGGMAWDRAMAWSQGVGELSTLLIANAYGGASTGLAQGYWGPKIFTSGPHYVGGVVLLLAGLALYGVRRWAVWALGAAAVFMVLLSLGEHFAPLSRFFFAVVPLFDAFRVPETWLVIVALALAVLAGYGVYYLMRAEPSEEGERRKTRAVFVGLGVLLGAVLLLNVFKGVFFSFEAPTERQQIVEAIVQQQNLAPSDPQVVQTTDRVLREARVERRALFASDAYRTLGFLFVAGVLLVLSRLRRIPSWGLAAALALLVTVDLWNVGTRYFNDDSPSFVSRTTETVIPETDADRFIVQQVEAAGGSGHFRTLPLALNPFNNSMPSYYYESSGGYHGAKLGLYQDYIDHLIQNPDGTINRNGIDLMSTRFLLTGGAFPGYNVEFQDARSGIFVLENPNYLPRAFLVGEVEEVADREATFARLRDPSFNLRRTALVHEALPPGFAPVPVDSSSQATVSLERFTPREIVWRVNTDASRLLVASEVYYPAGWHATIDAAPAPILRVNHLLRGVAVPAGDHLVTMRFDPPRHALGVTISAVATALVYFGIVGLLGLLWYRRGKTR